MNQNQNDDINTQKRTRFRLDPRRLVTTEGTILPETSDVERIELARVVIDDLRDHPPPRNKITGAAVVDAGGIWKRNRDKILIPGTERTPALTVGAFLQRPLLGGPSEQLKNLAGLLLSARAKRQQLLGQLATLDSVAALFDDGDVETELQAIAERAAQDHVRVEKLGVAG